MGLPATKTFFNTKNIPEGKPIMLIWFDPNCKECQKETEHLLANMNSFRNVNIYMATSHNYSEVMVFYNHLRLDTCKNITVGIDKAQTIPRVYQKNSVPITIVYDGEKKFKAGFEGLPDFNKLKESVSVANADAGKQVSTR